jgi:hypothetical protein
MLSSSPAKSQKYAGSMLEMCSGMSITEENSGILFPRCCQWKEFVITARVDR